MQKGDIISPKGAPITIQYKITGENRKHPDYWNVKLVEPTNPYPADLLHKRGMIRKDDDRWEVFNG